MIFPSLLIGVLFGALYALILPESLFDDYSGLSVYAVCGMMAMMSPVIGAPMTALLLVFELTRSYEFTIAAMVAIVFSNFVAHRWYGRSLYDRQLNEIGIDLSMGRERAYLLHRKVAELVVDSIPVLQNTATVGEVRAKMLEHSTASAVVIDAMQIFQGIVYQQQLAAHDDHEPLTALRFQPGEVFNQNTSVWEAMQTMRNYIGEAIPVIDSDSGQFMGMVPEAVVINAYLDAAQELRREEHEV